MVQIPQLTSSDPDNLNHPNSTFYCQTSKNDTATLPPRAILHAREEERLHPVRLQRNRAPPGQQMQSGTGRPGVG